MYACSLTHAKQDLSRKQVLHLHSMYTAQLLHAQTNITACGDLQIAHANVDSTAACAAAPLMMTGVQFAIQNLLARLVIKVGIVQRTAAAVELDWRQYMQQGEHQGWIAHVRQKRYKRWGIFNKP